MTDQDIISYYSNKVVHSWKTIPQEHKDYLDIRYVDSKSHKESVWRILYNIEERPVCQVCGNPVEFVGRKNNIFAKTCCKYCFKITTQQNTTKHERKPLTEEELYYLSLSRFEKVRYTCLKKYGVEHVSQLPTNTFKSNNPQKRQDIKDKTKETRLQRYGQYMSPNNIESLLQDDVKKKRRESFIHTMEYRYGDINYRNWDKYKQTCLERYGVDCWSKTNEFKQVMYDKHDEIQQKIYKTHKINNSFNQSKPENESYEVLKEIFPDVIREYKSDVYPFRCDFYIPSIDTYIECHYHWTYGKRLYSGSPEDMKIVAEWKQKNTDYYKNAIKVWTKLDVKKYQCALEHNLNYLLFYNMQELIDWANSRHS